MEDFKNLINTIEKHSKEQGVMMDSQSIVNFLDHISSLGDWCEDCARAMSNYTNRETLQNFGNARKDIEAK